MEKKKIYQYVLSLGHLCSDINQSILSAILPFLIATYNFDYATAAILVTVSNIFGALVQPIFGNIADKKNKPCIMVIGVMLAGGGMAITGYITNFFGLCIAVIVSGIGIAMFHPQAAKFVNLSTAQEKQGKGVSIFSFGGKIGFTFGPIFTSFLIVNFGMKGTIIFLVPSILFAVVSSFFMKDFKELESDFQTKKKEQIENLEDDWKGFAKLCIVVFGRSIITNGLSTYLALYFISAFQRGESQANMILSAYYACGAICTLFGGSIADRFGHKRTIQVSFMIFTASMVSFILTHNYILSLIMLVPMSCGESLSYSPLVVLGQRYLPNHTGFASGVTLGLAVSIGAIVCPLLGIIADSYSLSLSFVVIALIGAVAFVTSLLLPNLREN